MYKDEVSIRSAEVEERNAILWKDIRESADSSSV